MELDRARAALGVVADADWPTIKQAYRDQISVAHPDHAGDAGVESTLALNAAYRVLGRAHKDGRLHEVPSTGPVAPPPVVTRPAGTAPDDVRILDGSTLSFGSPPAETFRRLVEGIHELGEISYLDRSAALVEAIVRLADHTPASLVFSLQWRAHDSTTEAFGTLEALDRAESLDVSGVLEQLAQFLPDDQFVG